MKIVGIDGSVNGTGLAIFDLDEKYEIKKKEYMFFTQKKKDMEYCKGNISGILSGKFENDVTRNAVTTGKIRTILEAYGVEYAAIEDYAMGIKNGRVFLIGEFCGLIKHYLHLDQIPFRVYDIPSIKLFASGKGNADKEGMLLAHKLKEKSTELLFQEKAGSPMSDLIDAHWIAKILQTELSLRAGMKELKNLPEQERNIFLRTTKGNPVNILSKEWNE